MATTSGNCRTATNLGASSKTTHSGDSSPHWSRAFRACDCAKTSPGGANSVRSWGIRKHQWCGCGIAAARESAGGDSVPNVPLPNVPLPDVPPTVVHPDSSVGKEWASYRVEEEALVIVLRLGSGSCLVRFLRSNLVDSDIDYYTCYEVFGLLRVHFICGFYIGFLIHSIMGHRACSVVATSGVSGTSLWWCWGSINQSS